jgi:hypothetical protein
MAHPLLISVLAQYGLFEYHLFTMMYFQPTDAPTTEPSAPSILGNVDGTVQMQLVILVTTIAGFLFQAWQMWHKSKVEERNRIADLEKEERKRKWDVEDRERARREANEQAEMRARALHQKVDEVGTIAAAAAEQSAVAGQKIDERTFQLEQQLKASVKQQEVYARILRKFEDPMGGDNGT